MPMRVNIPKGCSASRGASDIRHITSQGGNLSHHINRLYMLTVRRESLMNKRHTLEVRLREIKGQLAGIEVDIRATEKQCRKLKENGARRKRFDERMGKGCGNGRELKKMPLQF